MAAARILLVEDNEMNRRLVRDILVHRGHEVIEATRVEEGRERLKEGSYDLVLLDIQIPGGGGEVLLSEIRGETLTRELPVVAVTAYAMRGDRERLLEAGFDGYMAKPIDVRSFAQEVESYLRR